MKETLRKERGEGQELKRKYDNTLSDLEKLKGAYKILESDKFSLTLSIEITEGEKRDLEGNFSELEKQKSVANKRTEELEDLNSLLEEKIKVFKEKKLDLIPFCSQGFLMQRKIHQVQLKLTEELYKIRQIKVRLKKSNK